MSRILAGVQTATIQFGRCRWVLGGKPHPLQRGAFGPIVAYLRLLVVARIRLASLDDRDAVKLGYRSLEEYKQSRRHKWRRWTPTREVVWLEFTVQGKPEKRRQATLFDEEGSDEI